MTEQASSDRMVGLFLLAFLLGAAGHLVPLLTTLAWVGAIVAAGVLTFFGVKHGWRVLLLFSGFGLGVEAIWMHPTRTAPLTDAEAMWWLAGLVVLTLGVVVAARIKMRRQSQ